MKRNAIILTIIACAALLIAAVLNVLTQRLRFSVVTTNLESGQGFSAFQPVVFEFNKPVTDTFVKTCQLTTDPVATFDATFKDTVLSFTPQKFYLSQTQYSANLQCSQVSFSGKFTSLPQIDSTQDDLNRVQTQLDFETGQTFQNIYTQRPWLAKLPLKGQYYTLVYSQVEDKYLVLLNIPSQSKLTQADVEPQIKADLQKIGAPDLEINYVN